MRYNSGLSFKCYSLCNAYHVFLLQQLAGNDFTSLLDNRSFVFAWLNTTTFTLASSNIQT